MTRSGRVLLAGLALAALQAVADGQGDIEVRVEGVRSDAGQVFVTLFDSDEGFPGAEGAGVGTLSARQVDGTAVVVFENVAYGEYAVAAYHDEDGNGKMKTVYGSIPLEGIGISRDAKGVMGPPKFKDAKFPLDSAAASVTVTIRY